MDKRPVHRAARVRIGSRKILGTKCGLASHLPVSVEHWGGVTCEACLANRTPPIWPLAVRIVLLVGLSVYFVLEAM